MAARSRPEIKKQLPVGDLKKSVYSQALLSMVRFFWLPNDGFKLGITLTQLLCLAMICVIIFCQSVTVHSWIYDYHVYLLWGILKFKGYRKLLLNCFFSLIYQSLPVIRNIYSLLWDVLKKWKALKSVEPSFFHLLFIFNSHYC